jgi:CIC family chloride channel protein
VSRVTAWGRSVLYAARRRARSTAYLRKWVVLGALIGLIAGIGAAVFFTALDLATHYFLGVLAGYEPSTPVGEGGAPITLPPLPLVVPLVVALGGLISGIIVFRLAPEAEGHGTDAAISAFHHGARRIRSRIPLVKLVASAITIGSGGSGGREGPTAQIGAGFGSWLARVLDLDARDARIAVSSGLAAGIGAIFRAPLGGAVLGAEIPYREDVESDALVPSFIASVVAFSVFGVLVGFSPIFGQITGATFSDPRQLVYYALIGLAAGIVGRLYIGGFYGATDWFGRWHIPREVKPAIAGFVVGCIGIAVPGALGTGYGWVQSALSGQSLLALPIWIVIALPFAKIAATALSVGSGGSGGIFGPGMVIGGLLGASIWRLLEPIAPAIPADPAPFVIVAMMALFGSIAHAPLAVMLMVAEMTGNLAMLAPAMIAIGIATVVVGDKTIYRSQLKSRADSPAHRFRFAMPLMSSIPAGDAARQPRLVLSADMHAAEAVQRMAFEGVPGAPVLNADGIVRGTLSLAKAEAAPPQTPISELTERGPIVVAEDGLDDALGRLADEHATWAPVTSDGQLVGVISTRDAMDAYRRALAGNVRQIRGVGAHGALLEGSLPTGSPLAGGTVMEAHWPKDVVVVAIQRGERLIIPTGATKLEAGDRLTLFATPESEEAARAMIETERKTTVAGANEVQPATGDGA